LFFLYVSYYRLTSAVELSILRVALQALVA